jgi:hypothetical protein
MHARLRRWIVMLIMVLLVTVPMTLLAAEWSEVTDGRLLEADKDANNWLTYYRTHKAGATAR